MFQPIKTKEFSEKNLWKRKNMLSDESWYIFLKNIDFEITFSFLLECLQNFPEVDPKEKGE